MTKIKKKKIILITGIRPNIVKAFSLHKSLVKEKRFETILLHTDQHFDKEMFELLWKEFKLPKPILLNLKYINDAERLGNMISLLGEKFSEIEPDLVVVFGDGDSTLAGALAANKLNIKLAHIEAGLRSFDEEMPEEANRILVDHLADFLFTSEDNAKLNLVMENININKIFFVGNIMIDTLVFLKNKIDAVNIEFKPKSYVLLTLHRQSNVDVKKKMMKIFDFLSSIETPILFPIHPRTKMQLENFDLMRLLPENIKILSPLSYLTFLALEKNASVVLTDSGGVQEETTFLKVPCLTLRSNTERPATIYDGTNRLILDEIEFCQNKEMYRMVFQRNIKINSKIPNLWDGEASKRIVEVLKEKL